MPYKQRDIVKVKRRLPTGEEKTHPFLIISNERANSHEPERFYTGVMITHYEGKDKFYFLLTPDMVDGRIEEDCQIRLHIITSFSESEISRDMTAYLGKMKPYFFQKVMEAIKEDIYTVDRD